eukprot:c9222_g1_i1.p1 GENE.c9222_g1_i1~~c9222_g1_i1.p1  ORF type:complete len:750 (+),score=177.77 c9222_g1_i1:1001-3250(+)
MLTSGKYMYEVEMLDFDVKNNVVGMFGWADSQFSPDNVEGLGVGCDAHSWSFDGRRFRLFHTPGVRTIDNAKTLANKRGAFQRSLKSGDVLGLGVDLDSKQFWFCFDQQWVRADVESFLEFSHSDCIFPAISFTTKVSVRLNFGASPFVNPLPPVAGFKPVDTTPLQEPEELIRDPKGLRFANTRRFYMRSLEELLGPNTMTDWKGDVLTLTGRSIEERRNDSRDRGIIQQCVKNGWTEDESVLLISGINYANPLGKAIFERNPKYIAFAYAFYELVAARAKVQAEAVKAARRSGDATEDRSFFRQRNELVEYGEAWLWLTVPDATGFRGFTSYQAIPVFPRSSFSLDNGKLMVDDTTNTYETKSSKSKSEVSSPLIQFLVSDPDDTGLHNPVALDDCNYLFPPMTLFRVVEELDQIELNGQMIKQEVIVVKPTFLLSPSQTDAQTTMSKFANSTAVLGYGSRDEYIRGIEEILENPPLTMEEEFLRDDKWKAYLPLAHTFKDCSGAAEWAYVTGPAKAEHTGNGNRDPDRDGWTVDQFVAYAADTMTKQGMGPEFILTRDEVIAVRLYSGPAFLPINQFLREVAKLSPDWRRRISHNVDFTFSSTVAHINSAVRKLSKVPIRSDRLYRGVRGVLPERFFKPDKLGIIAATDFGFLSTSTQRATPINYMHGTSNVLWSLHCRIEDEAFHNGGDISFLSMFPHEKEVLFPPLTMLRVVNDSENQTTHSIKEGIKEAGVEFVEIEVVPFFA